MEGDEELALDYFAAGVPALAVFSMSVGSLRKVLSLDTDDHTQRTLRELSLIGAIGYFEAFCKDHVASIINLAPFLIAKLSNAGIDIRIDPSNILHSNRMLRHRVGFLVAERLDLGTAAAVNNTYGHLLRVTPFSKNAAKTFSDLLRDRNLFVHHGGLYTRSYAAQTKAESNDIYFQSKILSRTDVETALEFLMGIASGLGKSSKAALANAVIDERHHLSEEAKSALGMLDWEGIDDDE